MRWKRRHDWEHTVHSLFSAQGMPESSLPRAYVNLDGPQEIRVLLSREVWEPGDERWHFSISTPNRVPTWAEVAETIHDLRPGVPFVLGVPPKSLWMNVHEHVLHAWETKDRAMIEQWRINATGDKPS